MKICCFVLTNLIYLIASIMIVIIYSQAGDGPSEADFDISPNTVSLQNLVSD